MARQFDVVIERDEEGIHIASVPRLPGCHTDATSLSTNSSLRSARQSSLSQTDFALKWKAMSLET